MFIFAVFVAFLIATFLNYGKCDQRNWHFVLDDTVVLKFVLVVARMVVGKTI